MQKLNFPAFTLVELIVVITIVGILSTVGFVSYSNYLTGARDSNRISQMVKLSDSLQVYSATRSLPLPDNHVEITASGTTIAYQGELGTDVLETIDFTNGGTDPKDDSFYTYYLTKDRNSLQLMALMEEQASVASLIQQTQAQFEDRFPKTYGKSLGLLTQVETNLPIQNISSISLVGNLDILNSVVNYTANFGDYSITSQGKMLLYHMIGSGRLRGYWSFDSISGTTLLEESGSNYHGELFANPSTIGGITNNALLFHRPNQSYVDISLSNDDVNKNLFTISFWILPDEPATLANTSNPVKWGSSTEGTAFGFTWNSYLEDFITSCTVKTDKGFIPSKIEKTIDNTQWNLISCVYDGDTMKSYLNGKLENTSQISGIVSNDIDRFLVGVGAQESGVLGGYYNGGVDELSIFRKALDANSVKLIYDIK